MLSRTASFEVIEPADEACRIAWGSRSGSAHMRSQLGKKAILKLAHLPVLFEQGRGIVVRKPGRKSLVIPPGKPTLHVIA
jgi:hypothetical protein